MASGDTHDNVVVAASIALAVVNPIAGGACLIGGLLLSPDIDCNSNPVRRLKVFPPLYWMWAPWQQFNHRSIWTHFPILCTALKMTWLWLWGAVALALYAVYHDGGLFEVLALWRDWGLRVEWLRIFAGWAIADVLHWLLDGCPIKK